MKATPFNPLRKREELKAQRNLLFNLSLRNPLDTPLALKIKSIDDQIAASDEQMKRERAVELDSTLSRKASRARGPRAELQKT